MAETSPTFTAFQGALMVASGGAQIVAAAVHAATDDAAPILIFDDATGRQVELDRRASAPALAGVESAPERPGRGRPKLGVVPREVTLLPRHWEWLSGQPGGASAALRRLVEEARRTTVPADKARRTQQALYGVMSALAGDLPGFEEAARALYARDDEGFDKLVAAWPEDVRDYVGRLAAAERTARVG